MREVIIGIILIFLFPLFGFTLEEIPLDYSSPIVKTVLKSQEARENKDFKSVWELTDKLTKQERFNTKVLRFFTGIHF